MALWGDLLHGCSSIFLLPFYFWLQSAAALPGTRSPSDTASWGQGVQLAHHAGLWSALLGNLHLKGTQQAQRRVTQRFRRSRRTLRLGLWRVRRTQPARRLWGKIVVEILRPSEEGYMSVQIQTLGKIAVLNCGSVECRKEQQGDEQVSRDWDGLRQLQTRKALWLGHEWPTRRKEALRGVWGRRVVQIDEDLEMRAQEIQQGMAIDDNKMDRFVWTKKVLKFVSNYSFWRELQLKSPVLWGEVSQLKWLAHSHTSYGRATLDLISLAPSASFPLGWGWAVSLKIR